MQTIMKTGKLKRRLALFVAMIMTLSLWTAVPLQASAASDLNPDDIAVPAQTITVDDFEYYIPDQTQANVAANLIPDATIINYTGAGGEITIPVAPVITNDDVSHAVTSIGAGAFAAYKDITSVTIPTGITSIGTSAFYGCVQLATVTLPTTGLTSIGERAFYDCTALSSITIPASVTVVGRCAFFNCTSLNITLPSTVITIGVDAFGSDGNPTTVTGSTADYRYTVADNEATLWKYTGVSDTPSIPLIIETYSVTSLGAGTFTYNLTLKTVSILANITFIHAAFGANISLTAINVDGQNEVYESRNGVLFGPTDWIKKNYNNGEQFIFEADMLTLIVYPLGKTDTEYAIPSDVEIAAGFGTNRTLTKVTIPASVETGGDAFGNCLSLTAITVDTGNVRYWSDGRGVLFGLADWTEKSDIINNIGNDVLVEADVPTLITYPRGKTDTSYTIPAVISNKPAVRRISGFSNNTSLTTVIIPNTVTGIIGRAFYNCQALTSVTIPNSVTSIGAATFQSCRLLNNITIPASVTTIGINAFNSCTALTSIAISSNVTNLSSQAFRYCTALSEVTLQEGMRSIPARIFDGCTALTSITIPSTVESIGDSAFRDSGLTSITLPSAVTRIGLTAFQNSGLTSATINGAATIADYAFEGCMALASVSMDSVTSIGNFAFSGTGLTSVAIPLSANGNIGNSVFNGSASLVNATIPEGITGIGTHMFSGCTSLTSVNIPSSLTSIPDFMFRYTGLTSITIPGTVESIGANAFRESALTSVSIPTSVTSIGTNAFNGCAALETITLPNSIETIGSGAFNNCAALVSATVSAVTSNMFTGCDALATITIASGATSLSGTPFATLTSLTTVNIPASVTSIGNNVFKDIKSLTDINVDGNNLNFSSTDGVLLDKPGTTLTKCPEGKSGTYDVPSGVTTLGDTSFNNCALLTTVNIPASVASIGGSTFNGCAALSTITVNESNENFQVIDGVVFNKVAGSGNATSLFKYPAGKTDVSYSGIPSTVTNIGGNAFNGNTSLTSITLPTSVNIFYSNAFINCTALKDVIILRNATMGGSNANAFTGCDLDNLTLWIQSTNTNAPTIYSNINCRYLLNHITVDDAISLNNGASQTLVPTYFATAGDSGKSEADEAKDALVETPGVTWEITSSTPNGHGGDVVTVDNNGKITAVGDGTATVKATVIDEEMMNPGATIPPVDCTVTVATENATITKFDLEVGNKTYTGTITADPKGVYDGIISVELDPGTELTEKLTPSITVGNSKGDVTPSGAQDFTSPIPVSYRVTYNNGSETKNYYNVIVTAPRVQPAAGIDYEAETLTGLIAGEKYTFNGSNEETLSEATYPIDSAWFGTDLSIVRTGNGGYITDSAAQELEIKARPNAPDPASIDITNETIAGKSDGIIEGINVDMEYRKVEADQAPDEGWTTDGVDDDISNLAAGDYQIRVKAVEDTSFASEPITVTIAADAQPSRILSVTAPEFTAVTTGYARPEAKAVVIANSGNWQATIESVTVSPETAFEIGGEGLAVGANDGANNGSIDTWTIQPKAGLSAGTYNATITVTYDGTTQATATANVSFTVNPVVIPPPPATDTYAVTVTGGTGSGDYAENAIVTITANAAPDGKVFDAWTSDDVTFASATSATTSFTMPAKAVAVTATYKDDPNAGEPDDPDNPNPPDNPPATDNGWVKNDDGEWEYLTGGEAKTGWLYDTNYKAWYYLASDGVMQTGWDYVGGKWYYLASNGKMQTGWLKDGGSWYYLAGNGAMVAAKWFKDTNGSWYYLSGNGKMLTGKQTIGGKVYSFKSNGVWIA
jgi:hypothetical protein